MIESEVGDVYESIQEAFNNYGSLQKNALIYGEQCLSAADYLADRMLKKLK